MPHSSASLAMPVGWFRPSALGCVALRRARRRAGGPEEVYEPPSPAKNPTLYFRTAATPRSVATIMKSDNGDTLNSPAQGCSTCLSTRKINQRMNCIGMAASWTEPTSECLSDAVSE